MACSCKTYFYSKVTISNWKKQEGVIYALLNFPIKPGKFVKRLHIEDRRQDMSKKKSHDGNGIVCKDYVPLPL